MREFPHLDWKRTPVTLAITVIVIGLEIACSLDESLRTSYYYDFFGINQKIWLGEPWRAFTCSFMHADLLHAAFNVYWFLVFGPVLERHFGSLKYLGIVVLLGYVSMMLEYVALGFNQHDHLMRNNVMIVGLSGVIYGMFGMLYVGRTAHHEMAEVCTEVTKWILIGWFFLCIALTYLNMLLVANVAHGMGFVFGVLYGHAAFDADGRRHFGWLCGAAVLTGVVLGLLVGCPGHSQYKEAQRRKAIDRTLRLQSFFRDCDTPVRHHRAATWAVAGISLRTGLPRNLGRLAADQVDPVDAGRRGFKAKWGNAPPWYDAAEDAVKPIDFRREEEQQDSAGPRVSMSWLRILAWIGIAMLGLLIIFALASYLRSGSIAARDPSKRSAGSDKHRIEALPFPMQYTYGNLLEAAEDHYRAGRYGEAIKYLFSFQLVELDRARCIRLTRGKTNRRYLREMRSRVTMTPWIEQTMVAFEDYFFGDYTIDRGRFEACWNQLPQFEGFLDRAHTAIQEDSDARVRARRQQPS